MRERKLPYLPRVMIVTRDAGAFPFGRGGINLRVVYMLMLIMMMLMMMLMMRMLIAMTTKNRTKTEHFYCAQG